MYKLIFSIIIFSVGFSNLTKAQNINNSTTAKIFVNEHSEHIKNTNSKDPLVVYKYKSHNKVGHKRINTKTPLMPFDKIPEQTKVNHTTSSYEPAHKKVILNGKATSLQDVRVDKKQDSLKAKNLQLAKNN